jgi:hypothetical protein
MKRVSTPVFTDPNVHQVDSCVNILLANGIPEMEFGLSLRNTDDCEQCSWSDVHVARFLFAFSLELSLFDVSGNDVVMQISWDIWVEGLSVGDEGTHGFLVDLGTLWSFQFLMNLGNVDGKLGVHSHVSFIEEKEDHVESG